MTQIDMKVRPTTSGNSLLFEGVSLGVSLPYRNQKLSKSRHFFCAISVPSRSAALFPITVTARAQKRLRLAVSGIVRRSQVGELGKQIAVGLYLVPGHPSVCEDGQEGISGVVGERPAIDGKRRWARGVIGQHVR